MVLSRYVLWVEHDLPLVYSQLAPNLRESLVLFQVLVRIEDHEPLLLDLADRPDTGPVQGLSFLICLIWRRILTVGLRRFESGGDPALR